MQVHIHIVANLTEQDQTALRLTRSPDRDGCEITKGKIEFLISYLTLGAFDSC